MCGNSTVPSGNIGRIAMRPSNPMSASRRIRGRSGRRVPNKTGPHRVPYPGDHADAA